MTERKKVKIEKIYDTKGIGLLCLSCGKYLGHVEYIDEFSAFSPINWMPVCNKCFQEKIGKVCPSEKMQYPLM